jgi:acetylornithine deacetylase
VVRNVRPPLVQSQDWAARANRGSNRVAVTNSPPPSAVEWLSRLVAHRTVAGDSNLSLIEEVHEFLTKLGVPSTVIRGTREGTANLYATLGPETGSGVVLSAHTDVVAAKHDEWSSDPFRLSHRGSRLYGRGTTDMKGFIAAVLATLPELLARKLRRPLGLALSADEELGVRGVQPMLDVLAKHPAKPAFCIVGEPTRMRVAVAHKGKIAFRIAVRGEAAHSSIAPNRVNAIEFAARAIGDLYAYQATLAEDTHDERFPVPYATLNVGRIHGGASVNVVADACSFDAEIRALPSQDHTQLMLPARRVVERMRSTMRQRVPNAGAEIEMLCDYPGLDVAGSVPELVAQLAESDFGMALDFGTEAGLYQQRLEVPVVVCGPGDIAQAHINDEYIEEDQLRQAQRFVHRIADFLAS